MRRLLRLGAALALMCGMPIMAADNMQTIGDWSQHASTEADWIATINESGSVLAKSCTDKENCLWLIASDMPCKESDGGSPALVNGAAGALSIESYCVGTLPNLPNKFRMYLTNPDMLDKLARESDEIAFAMATGGSSFRVFRFKTRQFSEALDVLRPRVNRRPLSTKDSKL